MKIDAVTKRWIRNASDEHAVANGCRFDEERGQFVVDWIERCCRLYEGETAGQALKCMPWQRDFIMRLFGWVKYSERWGREIRRFRQASLWVPKKNGKSPTLAALGLYLLVGDGEMGQKVYFGAKDGQQSREIAGKHAIEMVLASDELSAECSINKSLMQITHEETRSILKPISSGDSKAQKAKEGLNGSILIDETHVVDEAFMGRVSRAGISRSEPLIIEVSTAGDDPESYGKKRYDHGKLVESGDVIDESLLFISWEAPQDLSDADLAADPVKYGKMANPAWGHTVGEEEFLADFNNSRNSITEFARFKMYRLNIWQQSANPWLKMGDWQECKQDYTEADLEGRECFAGLDLAKTRDTTAITLIFPEDDQHFKQLSYYWLPKDRANELRDKVRYLQWASSPNCRLTLTDGNQTDYGFVRKKINELRQQFNLRVIAFDGTYAAMMMQRLREEDGMNEDEQLEFPQSMMGFTAATVAYENAVIEKRMHHNADPLLTWQAGNVKVKSDANENIRPVKQKHGDFRTIDGIVAGIMGLGAAIQNVGESSIYESEGLFG
jgi:phage terminase large subunit-like protein